MKSLSITLLSLFVAVALAFGAVAMLTVHYDVGGAAYVAAEYQGFGSLATGRRSADTGTDRATAVQPPARSMPASSAVIPVPVAARSA